MDTILIKPQFLEPVKLKRGDLIKLTVQDADTFRRYYSLLDCPPSDLSFSMMYTWDFSLNIRWSIINDNLCVFADCDDASVVIGPPLPGKKIEDTVAACFDIMRNRNEQLGKTGRMGIYSIPEELKPVYESIPGYKLEFQGQDYIYTSENLINLPGKELKKKRNLVNFFEKNFNYNVCSYNPSEHKEGCLDLLRRWKEKKSEKIDPDIRHKFETECITAQNTVIFADILGLKGIVVTVDGQIEAFTFGDPLSRNTANILIEKTNLEIKGLAQFIYREFVQRCWSGFELINSGDDWGIEYLALTKLSYQPVKIAKSYTLFEA